MTILDLLLFMVGLAGVGFMIYAFSVMKLFSQKARWFGISLLMLIVVLFGDRLMSPREAWNVPGGWPSQAHGSAESLFQAGWQEIPYVMFNLLLAEFGNFDETAQLPVLPSPSVAPSLSPSPVPRTPGPIPSFSPTSPTPLPSPSLSPSPVTPTPVPTVPTVPPHSSPSPTAPSIKPQQPASPVPAWW